MEVEIGMSVILELSPQQEAELKAQAEAQGLSVQDWLLQLAKERGGQSPFWKKILDLVDSMPPEAFEGLPKDGASEHDHYIYGSPKRHP
jgi:hypothetical protein